MISISGKFGNDIGCKDKLIAYLNCLKTLNRAVLYRVSLIKVPPLDLFPLPLHLPLQNLFFTSNQKKQEYLLLFILV